MPLSREERKQYLTDLLNKTPEHKNRIFYKEKPQLLPVYRIDLRFLIFNQHNGRLETEMLTWENETGRRAHSEQYDEEMHEQIKAFLWESNPNKNTRTQKDLAEKGQQVPGIVTLDGVIIDGNRRAMLLSRLGKTFFEAVVLPDAYDEDERAIVKLETQYQMGEDPKLDYGPLEKYLHAKRLHELDIDDDEGATLMRLTSPQEFRRLLGIMELMDAYLEHINCSGLYTLLKEPDGTTKEGMFVDLYNDLAKLEKGTGPADWDFSEIDLLDLRAIQFDHIMFGNKFSEEGKEYRKISHSGAERRRCFFAHEDIWKDFCDRHREKVMPVISDELGDLDKFIKEHPNDFAARKDAARRWISEWQDRVKPAVKENFGLASERLQEKTEIEIEPTRLLRRAHSALTRIDFNNAEFVSSDENLNLVKEINHISYKMKKQFDRNN